MRLLTTWIVVATVWLCSWGPASGTEADDAELAHRLKQLGTAFVESCKDCGYGFIDPDSAALLGRVWMLLEDWSIKFLETHPEQVHIDTAIRALGHEFDPRRQPLNADVEFLDATAYLVRLDYDRFGRVLIISPVDGQLVVTWRLADQPDSVVRKFPELAAWSSREQQSAVCAKLPDEPFCQMGVSAGGFGILPDSADGSRRFYVLSTYLKEAGCDAWSELSIWAWRKSGVVPLLANWYADNCEYGETRFDGHLLHVQVRSGFKALWACASCRSRALDWAIAVGANGVKDLGKKSLDPEVDHVDELFDRLLHGKSTDDLAAPQVAKKLQSFVRTLHIKQAWLVVGEFLDASVSHKGASTLLCLWVDSFPGRFDFTLEARHGGFYATHVMMRRGESCGH